MSQQPERQGKSGRVDHFAHGLFNKLLQAHANPEIRFACRMFEGEIQQCFEENLGPGTTAHDVGQRIIRAMDGDK